MTVEALKVAINDPNVIVLDSRFYLTDINKGHQEYLKGHIPDALFIDMHRQLSAKETTDTGRHPLPSIPTLIETLSAFGISKDSIVVLYDDMGGGIAARGWWMLSQMGISAHVLDGGIQAWVADGNPLEMGETISATKAVWSSDQIPAAFVWEVHEDAVIANFELDAFQLVDARPDDRFHGENETIDPVAGHIPGAINRPFMQNLTAEGCFKSAEVLRAEWLALGYEAMPVVHYCGSGATACHNVLATAIAGFESKQVFVGSWSQWSKRMMNLVMTAKDDQ